MRNLLSIFVGIIALLGVIVISLPTIYLVGSLLHEATGIGIKYEPLVPAYQLLQTAYLYGLPLLIVAAMTAMLVRLPTMGQKVSGFIIGFLYLSGTLISFVPVAYSLYRNKFIFPTPDGNDMLEFSIIDSLQSGFIYGVSLLFIAASLAFARRNLQPNTTSLH